MSTPVKPSPFGKKHGRESDEEMPANVKRKLLEADPEIKAHITIVDNEEMPGFNIRIDDYGEKLMTEPFWTRDEKAKAAYAQQLSSVDYVFYTVDQVTKGEQMGFTGYLAKTIIVFHPSMKTPDEDMIRDYLDGTLFPILKNAGLKDDKLPKFIEFTTVNYWSEIVQERNLLMVVKGFLKNVLSSTMKPLAFIKKNVKNLRGLFADGTITPSFVKKHQIGREHVSNADKQRAELWDE